IDVDAALSDAPADVDDLLLQGLALPRELGLALGQRGVAILPQDFPHFSELLLPLLLDLLLHELHGGGELPSLLVADRSLNLEELVARDLAPAPWATLYCRRHLSTSACPCQSFFNLVRPSGTLCQPCSTPRSSLSASPLCRKTAADRLWRGWKR